MAFVKLDCGMLDSTIWVDREAREVFITALLMAVPLELPEATQQIEVASLNETGYSIPPGWYGFVPAAGPGIVRRAGLEKETGLAALVRLCSPEDESRTPDHGGRRMARVDGGYLILNYDKYRQKDHSNAERQKRFRERKRNGVIVDSNSVICRNVTEAEGEAEGYPGAETDIFGEVVDGPAASFKTKMHLFDEFWDLYPRKTAKGPAADSWAKLNTETKQAAMLALGAQIKGHHFSADKTKVPHPATWLNQKRWLDEIINQQGNGETNRNQNGKGINSGNHQSIHLRQRNPELANSTEPQVATVIDNRHRRNKPLH